MHDIWKWFGANQLCYTSQDILTRTKGRNPHDS